MRSRKEMQLDTLEDKDKLFERAVFSSFFYLDMDCCCHSCRRSLRSLAEEQVALCRDANPYLSPVPCLDLFLSIPSAKLICLIWPDQGLHWVGMDHIGREKIEKVYNEFG